MNSSLSQEQLEFARNVLSTNFVVNVSKKKRLIITSSGSIGYLDKDEQIEEIGPISDVKAYYSCNNKLAARVSWHTKSKKDQLIYFATRLDRQKFLERLRAQECANLLTESDPEIPFVEDCNIFVGTWNAGNTSLPDLTTWLKPNGNDTKKFDIYVIGVQECEYKDKEEKSVQLDFITHVTNVIGDSYIELVEKALREIRVVAFVHKDVFSKVSKVSVSREATGIAHVFGNKGGIAIKFVYNKSSFCFFNSHLAAHQQHIADRNSDFTEIVDGVFGKKVKAARYDHLFWMGDLNYRIDLPREEVCKLIFERNWNKLKEHDQLLIEKKAERVFQHWNEGDINFRPTYRYTRGTDDYNPELGRIPAWCDRILWRSIRPVIQHEYQCVDGTIQSSDHHPVYSTFTVSTLLECIPMRRADECYLQITNLKGTNLKVADNDGTSDPFVKFCSTFLKKEYKTTVQNNTVNPVWQDDKLPHLALIIDGYYVRHQALVFGIMDKDTLSNDYIGEGSILLSQLNDIGQQFDFNVPVVINGKQHGCLSGTIALQVKKAR